ncbi:PGPGW domain-containing protein [Nocardiopsis sp. CNT312]|uniref:PGPGW domain-containing protein n=1 Tax=Nocardiopsis sp. CNT312 TaxID=1137268 RepID=UPI0004B2A9CF|nr:PGPGW domain-containing protein [Nocardiopsis sp. CNT312]
MHAHPVLHLPWRIGVGVVGTLVILAGTVMLVTPGPGAAGIILGLLILSTEFGWAHRLLRPTRRWFRIAEKHGERFKNDLLRRYRKRRTTGAKPSAAE